MPDLVAADHMSAGGICSCVESMREASSADGRGSFDFLTKTSHGADSVLTGGWDTTSAMENKNGNKERRTRIEIAIGLTVVALLYLIDWLSR